MAERPTKDWRDNDPTTSWSAAAAEDLEARAFGYSEDVVAEVVDVIEPNEVLGKDADGDLVSLPLAGSGVTTVQDEGVSLTQRGTVNFVGAGVSAADSGGKTVVTIPGGGSSAYAPAASESRDWRVGRSFSTDFSNAARDAPMIDTTSFTYSTDSGLPCLTPAAANVNAVLTMKAHHQWRNVDIRVRYRMTTATPHPSTLVTMLARYLSLTDYKRATKSFNNASPAVTVGRLYGNAGQTLRADTTVEADITSTTARYLRFRVERNRLMLKSWLASAVEPDWQISWTRELPNAAYLDLGVAAGVILRPIDAAGDLVLQEFTALELLPNTSNLIANGTELANDQRTSTPVWWKRSTANTATRIADVVDVADRNGVTRRAFHLTKTVEDASSCSWDQDLWSAIRNRFNGTYTRNEPQTFDEFPGAVEIGLWSKGLNVRHNTAGSDFLGFAFVGYHFAENGTGLNTNPYWSNLGPDTADGTGGVGTWDWTYNRVRLIIRQPQRVAYLNAFFGFHDVDVLGEVWFHDITIRPVG